MAINLGSNLHPKIAKHIDDRYEVASKVNLDDGITHRGMVRYVVDEDARYFKSVLGWRKICDDCSSGEGVDGKTPTVTVGSVITGEQPSVIANPTETGVELDFILPISGGSGIQWTHVFENEFSEHPEFNDLYSFVVWVLRGNNVDVFIIDFDNAYLEDYDGSLLIE